MRFVPISMTVPGMYLATDLYDFQGRTVISKNCTLTDTYIARLKELGFGGIYIEDELSKGIELESPIPVQLRRAGVECLKKADIDQCNLIAKELVRSIMPQENISLDMADLRSLDEYTFAHSVNVAVLACVLGIGFGMNEAELEQLTLAGLLHDIGMLEIPNEIVNKTTRYTQDEIELLRTHPQKSYDMLKDDINISSVVRQAILFHHENEDGSGYPNGVTGENLSLFIKILHVVDIYDSMTSNCAGKDGYSPCDASEYLMGACGIMFDKKVVQKFIQLVPLYPKGSTIFLSDGTSGVVLENSGVHNLRPVVRLDRTFKEIDLSDRENLNITIVSGEKSDAVGMEKSNKEKKKVHYKIMVVDDMATNLQMIKEILEDDYELILMKSGQNALNYLEKIGTVDLILMDIDMPEMDGVETVKRIQKLPMGHAPVLFLSALCDRETVLMCKELKAAGYITRPYKAVYIRSEIERILSTMGA